MSLCAMHGTTKDGRVGGEGPSGMGRGVGRVLFSLPLFAGRVVDFGGLGVQAMRTVGIYLAVHPTIFWADVFTSTSKRDFSRR